MRLFDVIPDRFFSILTKKHKDLYVEALFVLRDAFKADLKIRRDELIRGMRISLASEFERTNLDDDEDRDLSEGENYDKVGLVYRCLRDDKWLEEESDKNSFDVYVTIPDYAIATINLLYSITHVEAKEYSGYVYMTYSSLEMTKENPDFMYKALKIAKEKTGEFIEELKVLYNNIRRYTERMVDMSINDLLSQHFDQYAVQVMQKVIDPIRTTDSVPRFKSHILDILYSWLGDDEVIEIIAQQGIDTDKEKFKGKSIDSVVLDINADIRFIIDSYNTLEDIIHEVEDKHSVYTRSSVQYMKYKINSDHGIKGDLVDIIKNRNKKNILENMELGIEISPFQFISDSQLYSQKQRRKDEEPPESRLENVIEDPDVFRSIRDAISNQYTTDKVDSFILSRLGEAENIDTANIRVSSDEDYVFFILSLIRGMEEQAPFKLMFKDGYVSSIRYKLPDAVFSRR